MCQPRQGRPYVAQGGEPKASKPWVNVQVPEHKPLKGATEGYEQGGASFAPFRGSR